MRATVPRFMAHSNNACYLAPGSLATFVIIHNAAVNSSQAGMLVLTFKSLPLLPKSKFEFCFTYTTKKKKNHH